MNLVELLLGRTRLYKEHLVLNIQNDKILMQSHGDWHSL